MAFLGRRTDWSRGIVTPAEESGLVEGKWVVEDDEQGAMIGGEGGRNGGEGEIKWERLRRMVSRSSQGVSEDGAPAKSFVAVSYAPLEAPFVPPGGKSVPMERKVNEGHWPDEERADGERGWTWGTKQQRGGRVAELSREAGGLERGWSWGAGSRRKYRAKSSSSKSSGRSQGKGNGLGRSDSVISRLSHRLFGTEPGSPSIYSGTHEDGAYDGIEGGEEDEEILDRDERLDAMLAESRVGHGDLAKRYISGKSTADDFVIPESYSDDRPIQAVSTRPYQNDGFRMSVALPTAPRPSHVSPTKSAVLRPTLPQTTPTKSDSLLFSYNSPPSGPSTYTALPPPRSSTRRPFPRDAASIPVLRGFSPPPRSTATPIDSLLLSPPTSSGTALVGSPMPAFEPGLFRASESAFSLAGIRGLVFDDETPGSVGEGGGGLKEIAERAPSRAEQTRRLKQSAPLLPAPSSKPPHLPSLGTYPRMNPSGEQPRRPSGPRVPQSQPRATSGRFNPIFQDAKPLAPLSHPSRVRAAVEQLETTLSTPPPAPSTTNTPYTRPMPVTPPPNRPPRSASRTKLPLPPSPTKLSRSATLGGGLSAGEEAEEENVGNLLLQRSKTSIPALSPSVSPGVSISSRMPRAAGGDEEGGEGRRRRARGPRNLEGGRRA